MISIKKLGRSGVFSVCFFVFAAALAYGCSSDSSVQEEPLGAVAQELCIVGMPCFLAPSCANNCDDCEHCTTDQQVQLDGVCQFCGAHVPVAAGTACSFASECRVGVPGPAGPVYECDGLGKCGVVAPENTQCDDFCTETTCDICKQGKCVGTLIPADQCPMP